jgi:hypothetical protein
MPVELVAEVPAAVRQPGEIRNKGKCCAMGGEGGIFPGIPNRSEAIRRMVELAAKGGKGRK